ncbi:uncharacterized protein [Rutidosis leptorrhynchoides]|uniref:uncharacterized protein n=1 Tax=Rutidosis leptorrhynchoides TaxID=125765 RepID=UPI003A9A2907
MFLKSSRSLVLVNRRLMNEIAIKRCLRQGDPLSPLLFIVVMEGLHILLKNVVEANLIRGTVMASGLRLNVAKSHIHGVSTSADEVAFMATCAGCVPGEAHFHYLDLLLGSNMNLVNNCDVLIERFKNILAS